MMLSRVSYVVAAAVLAAVAFPLAAVAAGIDLSHVVQASGLLGPDGLGLVLAAGPAVLSRNVFERKSASDDDGDPDADALSKALRAVKTGLAEQGELLAQFKEANDKLLEAKASGKAVGDLEAKVAKLGEQLDEISASKQEFEQLMLKMKRPGAGGGDEGAKLERECKAFNAERAAHKLDGPDLSVDEYASYKGAVLAFMRKGDHRRLSAVEQKAMLAGSDAEGGFLLPPSTVGRIIERQIELSPIRAIANVMTIGTEALEGLIDSDDAASGWVGETQPRPVTDTPKLGMWRIEAHEMYAQPAATQKLLDDAAIDVEAWLARKVARSFDRRENAAFVNGDGVTKPRGFCSYPTAAVGDDTRAPKTLEHVLTGVSGAFGTTPDVLFDLIGRFKDHYLQNGRWIARREVITGLRKIKEATTNAYIWQPGLQAGQPDRLLGYPISHVPDLPPLGAGSLSLGFGDFSEGYQIVDRQGIRLLRDPYTQKPYVLFYSTKRVGGAVLDFEAIKFVKFQ